MNKFSSAHYFDKFLSENAVHPSWVIVHQETWNGFWSIKPCSLWRQKIFRFLGRKLHNKYIYWLGRPLYWFSGLKTIWPTISDVEVLLVQ